MSAHRPHRFWTDEDVEKLIRLYKAGATYAKIREALGRSNSSVGGHINALVVAGVLAPRTERDLSKITVRVSSKPKPAAKPQPAPKPKPKPKPKPTVWTAEMDAKLLELAPYNRDGAIAQKLGVSARSVGSRKNKLRKRGVSVPAFRLRTRREMAPVVVSPDEITVPIAVLPDELTAPISMFTPEDTGYRPRYLMGGWTLGGCGAKLGCQRWAKCIIKTETT